MSTNRQYLGFSNSLNEAWKTFNQNAMVYVGMAFVFGAISVALALFDIAMEKTLGMGASIVVKILTNLIVTPVLSGGLYITYLNAVRGATPSIEGVFDGFSDMPRWIISYLALYGCLLVLVVPAGVVTPMLVLNHNTGLLPLMILLLLIVIGGASCLALFYSFAIWSVADGYTISDAVRRTIDMTEGNRLSLAFTLIGLGIVSGIGVIACCVGALITMPVAFLATGHIYNALCEDPHPQVQAPNPLAPPPPGPPVPPSSGPTSPTSFCD